MSQIRGSLLESKKTFFMSFKLGGLWMTSTSTTALILEIDSIIYSFIKFALFF